MKEKMKTINYKYANHSPSNLNSPVKKKSIEEVPSPLGLRLNADLPPAPSNDNGNVPLKIRPSPINS